MKRSITVLAVAMTLAAVAIGVNARAMEAQTSEGVLEPCARDNGRIEAADLPAVVRPGQCPVSGRVIQDGPVGSVLPPAGESVYVEALTTSGAKELQIKRLQNGTIELNHVGDDAGGEPAPADLTATRASGECSDRAFTDGERRVDETLRYRINRSTVPRSISRAAATGAIRRGGANVVSTRNACKLGDRVPVGLVYDGGTSDGAQIDAGVHCLPSDSRSVVSFGDLPRGILAATCNWSRNAPVYDTTVASDVKINRTDFDWTTQPRARSCTGAWDLESVMTHERGHTFGLGHVPEDGHRHLTMSTLLNGPCQPSERTLGRGDVLGLENKYR